MGIVKAGVADSRGSDTSYNHGSGDAGGGCGGGAGSQGGAAVLETGMFTGGGTKDSDRSCNYDVSTSRLLNVVPATPIKHAAA